MNDCYFIGLGIIASLIPVFGGYIGMVDGAIIGPIGIIFGIMRLILRSTETR